MLKLIHMKVCIHEALSFCAHDVWRKLVSAVVVGIRFLEVFKCQYTGAFLLVLACGLFGSFCITCNMFACGVIRIGDSIFMYFFAPDLLNICDMLLCWCILSHCVARWSTVACVSVTVSVSLLFVDTCYI